MMTRFRYKPFRRVLTPIITIGLRIEATWHPIEVYVDSGSLYTILHSEIAEGIGFDYISGERIYLQVGDGSFIPVYLHELEIQLGTERFVGKVGFSDRLGIAFNLLGRTSVFDRFKICFLESQGILTFESRKPGPARS